jgi:RNA-directed DNA polymerase
MPLRTARGKKRTALLQTLKQVFRSHRSRPVAEVIARINPILRGWVQYFAFGHSSRCFSYIRDWVEKKIRHHLARASQRHGFGWKRWSRDWLYGTLWSSVHSSGCRSDRSRPARDHKPRG